jgi:hypothetical protein
MNLSPFMTLTEENHNLLENGMCTIYHTLINKTMLEVEGVTSYL